MFGGTQVKFEELVKLNAARQAENYKNSAWDAEQPTMYNSNKLDVGIEESTYTDFFLVEHPINTPTTFP